MENLSVSFVSDSVISQIYEVRFYDSVIVTTVTSEALAADQWANPIRNCAVAITAKYSRETSVPAIIQLCCGNRCLIFQVQLCGYVPNSIQMLLNNPNNTVVGVPLHSILDILQARFGLVLKASGSKKLDLRDMVAEATKKWRIENIALHVLNRSYRTPKAINRRWGKGCLRSRQIMFASIDAYAIYLAASLLMA